MVDITAKQVLELAAKYIGYKEKASNKDLYSFTDNAGRGNFTMFQAELDKAKFWNTPKNGYEWCTSFVLLAHSRKRGKGNAVPYRAIWRELRQLGEVLRGKGKALHKARSRRPVFPERHARRFAVSHRHC